MPELAAILGSMPHFDTAAALQAQARWDSLAKPAGSLGLLEKAVVRVAGITGNANHSLDKRVLLVCCADNGVARHGVSSVDASVTAVLARALAEGNLCVSAMARKANVDVVGVDMGMNVDLGLPAFYHGRIANGTADMSIGPAMSKKQAIRAIRHGYELAALCHDRGYAIVATGEVGIGNTTTSSAIASVLLGKAVAEVTGRGAGISSEKLAHKRSIIEKAIAVNQPSPTDPIDTLAKLGGFDLAAMTGIYLGCAAYRLPVLVDGLISSVAALVAKRLCPLAVNAMLASHVSAEPAARWVLEDLGLEPFITAGMCLGEGSGAMAALSLLDMAFAVYREMVTLESLATGGNPPLP